MEPHAIAHTWLFVIAGWLIADNHSYPRLSLDAACSENCLTGCDIQTGICDECAAGRYGDLCHMDCDELCTTCNRTNGECIECDRGWYGEFCDLKCEGNCLTCDKATGDCLKCMATRWGSKCEQMCSGHCQSCDIDMGVCRSCSEGHYGLNCTETCGNCWKRVCGRISGECVYECEEGWFGATCTEKCLSNCSVCSDHDTCSICRPGLAGAKCESPCPSVCSDCMYDPTSQQLSCTACAEGLKLPAKDCTCGDAMCRTFSGDGDIRRCTDCQNGTVQYLDTCCPCANCVGGSAYCSSAQGCTRGCKPGFYSAKSGCDLPCATDHCILCQLARGSAKICTLCEDGWYPNFGECHACSENCAGDSHQCNNETGVCLYGCNEGWHSKYCDSKCNDTCIICDNDQGICKSCELGYWGIQCENRCPVNCKFCNITNGACFICEEGFSGMNCTDSCQNCVDEQCLFDAGVCDLGCKPGWLGTSCDTPCPPYCLSCGSADVCDICVPGRTGNQCQYKCPDKCSECFYDDFIKDIQCTICIDNYQTEQKSCECTNLKCHANDEQSDFKICKACEQGWFPYMGTCCPCSHCDQGSGVCERIGKCSDECDTHINVYDSVTTRCSTDCKTPHCPWCELNKTGSETCLMCSDGWYPTANGCHSCSDNCNGMGHTCDNITGHCIEGCRDGWQGYRCSTKCNALCTDCDEIEGVCKACDLGHWGDACEYTCEIGCRVCRDEECTSDQNTNFCNRTTGYCLYGCKPGLFGRTCDTHCKRCRLDKCDQQSGECMAGCESGWTGVHCDVSSSGGFEPMLGPVVGGAVGMGLVILILLVAFVCFIRKQKFSAKLKTHKNHQHDPHHHSHHHHDHPRHSHHKMSH